MTNLLILVVIIVFFLTFSLLIVLTMIGAGFLQGVARSFDKILDKFSQLTKENSVTLESLIPLLRFLIVLAVVFLLVFLQVRFLDPQPPKNLSELQFRHARYLITPVLAVLFIIIAGGRFIQDIYALQFFRQGLIYFVSSLFGLHIPNLVIDKGKPQTSESEFNPILTIGGPGYVQIQPGNAVVFRSLREITRTAQISSVYLHNFETIGHIAVLDDQHDKLIRFGELRQSGFLVTRDGIRVIMGEVNFRFRIIQKSETPRSLENPYPFDLQALMRMAINLNVSDDGQQTVRQAVRLLVGTAIRDELRNHTINELTAPHGGHQNPLSAISSTILENLRVWSIGVEVFMLDLGHIEIVEGDIHKTRINAWSSRWVGDVKAREAYAKGVEMAYEEYGRAQAQTELIMSIVHAMDGVDLGPNPAQNIRLLLLSRTAQVLQSLQGVKEEKDDHDI
jgi:hypothetical protein